MGLDAKSNLEKRIEFKEGILILEGAISKLYYWDKREKLQEKGPSEIRRRIPNAVSLSDLKKLEEYFYPLTFKKINNYTQARRTLTGGLEIKNLSHTTYFQYKKHFLAKEPFLGMATFSREEYKIIRGHYTKESLGIR